MYGGGGERGREIPKCMEVGGEGEGDTQMYGGGGTGGGEWGIPKYMEVGGEGCEEAWRDEVSKGRDAAPPPAPHPPTGSNLPAASRRRVPAPYTAAV